jgi:hypothetical protein
VFSASGTPGWTCFHVQATCLPSGDQQYPLADDDGNIIKSHVFVRAVELPREQQKGGLERIFGILSMLQDPPADAVDHRSMPAHQGLEGRLVASAKQAFDEVPIGLIAKRFSRHVTGEAAHKGAQIGTGHA